MHARRSSIDVPVVAVQCLHPVLPMLRFSFSPTHNESYPLLYVCKAGSSTFILSWGHARDVVSSFQMLSTPLSADLLIEQDIRNLVVLD